jgi:hypothetical protein
MLRALHPDAEAPLTEPLIVPVLFVSGMTVDDGSDAVRLTGWETTPFGDASERRVVVRIAMTKEAARDFHTHLGERASGQVAASYDVWLQR